MSDRRSLNRMTFIRKIYVIGTVQQIVFKYQMVYTRPAQYAVSVLEQSGVRLSPLTAAAAADCFVARLGRKQQVSIDSCTLRL